MAIREICWRGSQGTGPVPVIGRAWVTPNEWVDVQFGVINGPPSLDEWMNASEKGGGEMRVLLADGSYRDVVASAFSVNNTACGGSTEYAGGNTRLIE